VHPNKAKSTFSLEAHWNNEKGRATLEYIHMHMQIGLKVSDEGQQKKIGITDDIATLVLSNQTAP
jgi:hypothetical protein